MIKVKVPATSANFGPGFDCMGAALSLYNYIEIGFSTSTQITVSGEGIDLISRQEDNLIYQAAQRVLQELGYERNITIHQKNNIPLARGLGSSAACVAGGMMAARKLTGDKIPMDRIVELATEMEGHPDNVVPALFGGFCLSMKKGDKVIYRKYPLFKELEFVVGIPQYHLNTQRARKVLPSKVDFKDAIFNVSRAAFLAAGIVSGEKELLSLACEDLLHQPYRSTLVPGLKEIMASSKEKGALATFLSGAGPSVLCISKMGHSNKIGEHMVESFKKHRVDAEFKVLSASSEGVEYI